MEAQLASSFGMMVLILTDGPCFRETKARFTMSLPAQSVHQDHSRRWVRLSALPAAPAATPASMHPRRAPCASQARLRQCLGRPRSQYALNARREPMRRKRGRPTVIHAAQGAIPTAVQPHRAPCAMQEKLHRYLAKPRSRHARPALPAPLRQQEVRAFARRASMQTQYS